MTAPAVEAEPTSTDDWLIELQPACSHPEANGGGWLDILSERCDEEDAREALEDWVARLDALGFIPDSGHFRSQSAIAVIKRVGQFTYRVRADCWEHETDNGYCNGFGWLRLVRRPR